jgi:hypothetical protein
MARVAIAIVLLMPVTPAFAQLSEFRRHQR